MSKTVLGTVQKEVKSVKAKRELRCFVIAHQHLQAEFKDLCLDEQAILEAIGMAQEQGEESLAYRLKRMLGRGYYS